MYVLATEVSVGSCGDGISTNDLSVIMSWKDPIVSLCMILYLDVAVGMPQVSEYPTG